MKLRHLTSLSLLVSMPAQAGDFDHSSWNGLLAENVVMAADSSASAVNYTEFGADRATLKSYLDAMSKVSRTEFDAWQKPDQLAFLINAYNAWTVELILTRYPKLTSIKELGSLTQSPWQKTFIPLLGETVSLDNIEHDMIRGSGRYNDPRIHFGVNCASIGCPALLNEAFVGGKLDQQLEQMTKGFLSDQKRNRVANGKLAISSIFNWYGGDFEQGWRGSERLEDFLLLYGDSLGLSAADKKTLSAGEMEIAFLEYDWRLNDSKGPASSENPSFISPVWILRSNPALGAAAAAILLFLIGGVIFIICARRKTKTAA